MRANGRAHSCEGESHRRMEAKRAYFEQADTFGALADRAVYEERLARVEPSMCAEWTVAMSKATLRHAIMECFVRGDAMTALSTPERHN